jgi:hypothetical protein
MPRTPARALLYFLAATLVGGFSASAIELPAGSKNFSPPGSTPNYFSNEVGAAQGNRSAGSLPPSMVTQPTYYGRAPTVASRGGGRREAAARRRGHGRGRVVAVRGHAARAASRHASPARGRVAPVRARTPEKAHHGRR